LIYTVKTENHHYGVDTDQYKKYAKKSHHCIAPLVNKRKNTLFVMLYGQKDRSDAQKRIFAKNAIFALIFKEILDRKENKYENDEDYSYPLDTLIIFGMQFFVFFIR